MRLSLSQVFGVNASQSVNSLTINKADLPLLVSSVNNTANSLVVAIVLQLLKNFEGNLTDSQDSIVTDQNGIAVTYDNVDYWDNVSLIYWGKTLPRGLIRKVFLFYEYQTYIPS